MSAWLSKTTGSVSPSAVFKMNGTQAVAQVREVEDITVYPGCNLLLQKAMDPPNPQQIGEEVTFFLRFNNPTKNDMTDVVYLRQPDGSARIHPRNTEGQPTGDVHGDGQRSRFFSVEMVNRWKGAAWGERNRVVQSQNQMIDPF